VTPHDEIRLLMQKFQDGYTKRDLTQVDTLIELFIKDAEVIGTNRIKPNSGEWYMDRESARELVAGDWEGWGDLRLDLENMAVHSLESVGWIATNATVSQTIGVENYQSYLEFVKTFIDDPKLSAEQISPHSAWRDKHCL